MALTIEQINTKAATYTIVGWFAGLAYYNWFAKSPVHVSFIGHVVLVVVGLFAASIVIGMGVALLFGLITKLVTGRADGSPHGYAWGAFVSPVIAFFAAEPAIRLVARHV